jgi:hypothetical protein
MKAADIFFSLEYSVRIIILKRERIGSLQTPPPHCGPGCEGLFLYIEELINYKR